MKLTALILGFLVTGAVLFWGWVIHRYSRK